MNSNERFTLILILIGCFFGLGIVFIPISKASLYAAIPTSLISSAVTYLGIKKSVNNETD